MPRGMKSLISWTAHGDGAASCELVMDCEAAPWTAGLVVPRNAVGPSL